MTDWADEIAASLEEEDSTEGYDGCLYFNRSISKSGCAAALRAAELRGRVAGMREAADLIRAHRNAAPTFYWEDDEKALFNKIDRMVIAAASKLSPT